MTRTPAFWPTPWHVRLRRRVARLLRAFAAVALLAGGLALVWFWQGGDPPGATRYTPTATTAPRAMDGDSFVIGSGDSAIRARLSAIDAPEHSQLCQRGDGSWACGAEAYAAFANLLAAPGLTCALGARDAYQRRIATCHNPRDGDLGAVMVRRGLAIATGRADDLTYVGEEGMARAQAIGIWQGRFDRPADWRAAHGRGTR
jgi:endonuclease YncB( thermonuclease family)